MTTNKNKIYNCYFNYGFGENDKTSITQSLHDLLEGNIEAYLDEDEINDLSNLKINEKFVVWGPCGVSKETITRVK